MLPQQPRKGGFVQQGGERIERKTRERQRAELGGTKTQTPKLLKRFSEEAEMHNHSVILVGRWKDGGGWI